MNHDHADYETEIKQSCCNILHWNYRNLPEIPEDLRNYGKVVENLYLKGNEISSIPKWMSQLENLTELYLYDNHLRGIPEEISSMKSLMILDVGRNRITELPRTFTSLNSLYFFSANENLIHRLPEDIGKLKSLAFMHLSENCLTSVPESISCCNSLQEMVLDFNKLRFLPRSIVYLPNLSLLSLQGNDFCNLPAIPPHSKPKIRLDKCESLKYMSYDFAEYIQKCHVPVEWNFRNKQDQLPNEIDKNQITIHCSTGNAFILPFAMAFHKSLEYPLTLYELCLRVVYSMVYEQADSYRIKTGSDQLKILPKTIQNEIMLGPTALCQNCRSYLFSYTWLKLFEIQALHSNDDYRVEIVQYFCGTRCSKVFNENREHSLNAQFSLREIEWNCD